MFRSRKKEKATALSVYFKAAKSSPGALTLIVALVGSMAIIDNVLMPFTIARIFEHVNAGRHSAAETEAKWLCAGLALSAVALPLRMWLRSRYRYRIRTQLTEKVSDLIRETHLEASRGVLNGRASSFLKAWSAMSEIVLTTAIIFVVSFVGSTVLLLFKEPQAAILCFGSMLVCATLAIVTSTPIMRRTVDLTDAETEELAVFDAMMANIDMPWLVKLLVPIQREMTDKVNEAARRRTRVLVVRQGAISVVVEGIQMAAILVIVNRLVKNDISISSAYLILTSIYNVTMQFWSLTFITTSVGGALGEAEPMAKQLKEPDEKDTRPECPALEPKETIAVRDLKFVFPSEGEDVRSIQVPDFDIEGQVVQLTGPSGSGKSQILGALASGACTKGSIRTKRSGYNLREYRSTWLLNAPQTLDNTVMPVHRLFGSQPNKRLLAKAMRAAAFPTSVKPGRLLKNMSGGERSRAYLAALLMQALVTLEEPDENGEKIDRLLVVSLDEVTGPLDDNSAGKVRQGLAELLKEYPGLRLIFTEHHPALVALIEDPSRDVIRLG